MDYSEEVLSRLAGLVDIHSRINKIMFVVPTKTRSVVSIGGAKFNVSTTDRFRGNLSGGGATGV